MTVGSVVCAACCLVALALAIVYLGTTVDLFVCMTLVEQLGDESW